MCLTSNSKKTPWCFVSWRVCVCAQQDDARPRLYFLLTVPAIFDVYGNKKIESCFGDALF
jgi:hypothetical protein